MSVGGQVVKSYGYDAAGRTTSVVSPAGTTTLTYDFEGRATSIVGPGIFQTNVFNGLDTRVGSTTDSVTRTFLRDGAYVADPVLRDGAVIYTPDTSKRRGAVTTFLHSGLKNADAQSGPAQNLAASRAYDAFGNVLSSSGSWQGPFGYAGAFGYQEDATGLMLLGHRLYDPSAGRFLTRDPIKDGRNWYVYTYGSPITWVDPDGLTPIKIWILLKAGKKIVYWIQKNRRAAEAAAMRQKGQGRLRWDPGHDGGPSHLHKEGAKDNIHHTPIASVREAKKRKAIGWERFQL